MQVYFLTPFPEMVTAVLSESILGRAVKKGVAAFHIKNLFDYADPPHYRIDDYPFGGGAGMILKPEPVFRAVDDIKNVVGDNTKLRVLFPTPDGELFSHENAVELSKESHLVFISGHYKGIDQRIRENLVTDEVSIGDFVLTGGELPGLIMLDAAIRLIPGVLNSYESAETDSFTEHLLDGPHYTRPEKYRGIGSPKVLLSGNHKKIEDWKKIQREEKTKIRRPDLWEKYKSLE
ncbi:MAG: tRNA (guanosine(37)-N1)-methyltransferase TrmD [Candidatus Marinimicrobia bacterium]|nr:tRNA (guanosine(37)-N1)-methyltransferase TrmD [Candidatus Neomarinimicrobiota bacterium]MDP6852582.1 tRNA (guanosine(37)-N1)-methyltransferase TrmD [Candidatus Neomarinimicrobiota bacterium]MDP6936013.1 tRNA (guanosine(37)-N1)-methyltransferase TrmD [Candidatus Neomarinimicrobiota bacterium]